MGKMNEHDRRDRDIYIVSAATVAFLCYHFLIEEISVTNQRIIALGCAGLYLYTITQRLQDIAKEAEQRIRSLEGKVELLTKDWD